MADIIHYTLRELIEVGAICSRYRGQLADGTAAEICLLHADAAENSGQSIDRLQRAERSPHVDRSEWCKRLRLANLQLHPNCLKVCLLEEDSQQPAVAFPHANGPSLSKILREKPLTEMQLGALSKSCAAALVACEALGLTVGGLTLENVFLQSHETWQVDVSGLRSPKFVAAANSDEGLAFLPPVSSTDSETEDVLNQYESSDDIYSLAALLRHVSAISKLEESATGKRITSVTADCLVAESTARPSARQLLSRLELAQSLDVTSDSSVVGSGRDFEATLNVDGDIAVPAGMLVTGGQLGRYTICEKLGEGGMGSVYRAQDAVDGKSVAIKILNKQVNQNSIAARRFAKEARLLAKANNPYVANLFEVNADAVLPYMVVEYVDGGTLGSILKTGKPLAEPFALAVMTDAVRGLAIAHARGVVHRDFKPDNVLLTKDAHAWMNQFDPFTASESAAHPEVGKIFAKVSDFGLARTAEQSESMAMTRDGALLGTPLYMSPEQCRGEPAGLPSDVYSVGVTLFQLLSGKPPFEGETQVALLNQHCNASPPSLKKLQPQLSDALVRTVENCLAKNADARYLDAGALLIDLENILRGAPTSLGLHPPILSLDDPDVMRFEHSWQLTSSPSQLWPFVSNTDRVNHAIGLPAVTYTTRQDPVHGVQRFAETKVAGQRIRWQEHPYEWIEGRRLSVLREFTHGPFRWFVNVVELQPTVGGGTQINQTLIVTPRSWLGKQLARLQLGKKSKANFGRAYEQIDAYIAQSDFHQADRDPFIGRTELRPAQLQKLELRLNQLRECKIDPRVVDTIGQFLEHASDLEVARLRPFAWADRFQLDRTQVVNACLEGTRLGVFSLLWDILCPSCRIPADIQETLSVIKDHGFCDACNLNFGIDLAESVELIFRAHAEIRPVMTGTYCIGGPAWSRHVVAQVRLAAGERFACDLNLAEGAYIVRGPQLPFTVDLRVAHGSGMRRIELSLARPPMQPRIQLPVGSQVIYFCNDSAIDQQVRIERTASTHDALSAAKASTMALFRELFPNEVLSSDQIVSVAHITLMRVQLHDTRQLYHALGDGPAFAQIRAALARILNCVKDHSGAIVKTIGEGVLASFSEPLQAVQSACELLRETPVNALPLSVAIHSGAAMVATLDERLDYFGRSLQTLDQLIASAPSHTMHVSSRITELPEVRSVISEQCLKVNVVPQLDLMDKCVAHCIKLS